MELELLADAFAISSVHGSLAPPVHAGGHWGLDLSQTSGATLHAITAGTAVLLIGGLDALHLSCGDIVLLPTGPAHHLASERQSRHWAFEHASAQPHTPAWGTLRVGNGPTQTRILSAIYRHDATVSTRLFSHLPEVVHLPATTRERALDDTLRLLEGELSQHYLATDVVRTRLVDVLLIQVLRNWLEAPARHQASSPPVSP